MAFTAGSCSNGESGAVDDGVGVGVGVADVITDEVLGAGDDGLADCFAGPDDVHAASIVALTTSTTPTRRPLDTRVSFPLSR